MATIGLDQNALLQLLVGGALSAAAVAPAQAPGTLMAPVGMTVPAVVPPRVLTATPLGLQGLGSTAPVANLTGLGSSATVPPPGLGLPELSSLNLPGLAGATTSASSSTLPDDGGCKGKGSFENGKSKGKVKGKGKEGRSKAQEKIAAGEPVFAGIIRTFNAEKKSGKVCCEAIFDMTGEDVYAYMNVLEQARAGPGDTIAFFIHWSQKGQAQVSFPIMRIGASDDMLALKGTFRFQFAEGKKSGLIDCHETKEFFARDINVAEDLVEKAQLTDGTQVAFNARMSNDGQLEATEMEPCDSEWEPIPADLTVSGDARNILISWEKTQLRWKQSLDGAWSAAAAVGTAGVAGDAWGGSGSRNGSYKKQKVEQVQSQPLGAS